MKNKPYSEPINVSIDDRGTFVPFLNISDKLIPNSTIKRIYYVYNHGRNVVRGFHFHKKEWKLFIAVSGSAKITAINPKKSKEVFTFVSSVRKPVLVVIPPGYANGWMSLEENTTLLCCSTASLTESLADDHRYNPYKWGDVWQIKPR